MHGYKRQIEEEERARVMYWFYRVAATKYHKLVAENSQYSKQKVQNQGVSRAILLLKLVGKNPSLHLLASGVCQQSLAFLACRCICISSLLVRTQVTLD